MLDQLAARAERLTRDRTRDGVYETGIEGFCLLRIPDADKASHTIHKPALCFVLQGAKWTMFGNRRYDYRAGQALVASVTMPGSSRVVAASDEAPYIAAVIELDPDAMLAILEDMDDQPLPAGGPASAAHVVDCGPALIASISRALDIAETPEEAAILYPGVMRELCYRLLRSPNGADIARILLGPGHKRGVIEAIHALRNRYAEPIRVDELATIARLSPSAFHRQFKAITGMTPLQYQKQTRLVEARRMMLSEGVNAEAAAFAVGYESASQFSREYARAFGAPPRRDIEAQRKTAA
ncbi:AraC family transcriptional regulator [Martelella lutilitoris]|uniref:AraC family transcriptional regulator n=1 Tax=Martelella lutilitoris TaxID=2583532 RepID=A0A5C4JS11_9HYPH|nr:AraC family transcriptional regulator [Martelella lutilitoris]TNB48255.1 AraC family transcriptional regulator [Martelella lutilitoris]